MTSLRVQSQQPRASMPFLSFNTTNEKKLAKGTSGNLVGSSLRHLTLPLIGTTLHESPESLRYVRRDSSSAINIIQALHASNMHLKPTAAVPSHPLRYFHRDSVSTSRRNSIMPDIMKSGGFSNLFHSFNK